MKSTLIVVSSITQALKAKSELEKYRIICKIQKTKNNKYSNSCAYAIKVSEKDTIMSTKIIAGLNIAILDVISTNYGSDLP